MWGRGVPVNQLAGLLMGEPAEVHPSPTGRTTCLYCGVELGSVSSAVKGLCVACSSRIVAPTNRPRGGGSKASKPQMPSNQPQQRPLQQAPHSRAALAELLAKGPTSETPQMVGELLAADKR